MSATPRRFALVLALALLLGSNLTVSASGWTANAASPGTATAISAGGYHGCAITPKERLKCWGDNVYGQLGIGSSSAAEFRPLLVPNLKNVKNVSVGAMNTCAVLAGGKLKCWGDNSAGQVGDGSTTERRTPKQVAGLTSGVKAVSVGSRHTCAVLKNGKVKCWGYNAVGQVGNGTDGNQYETPQTAKNVRRATQVSAGGFFSCATVNEKAKCWGYNLSGQLGDGAGGTTSYKNMPTQVHRLDKNVKRVIAGASHACAILVGGRLKCWGLNDFGQVGTGSTGGSYNRPQSVIGMDRGVTRVDPGGDGFTCAVKNGKAKCWGIGRDSQLGTGNTDDRDVPTQVSGLTKNVVDVDAGWYHACALKKSGAEKCWGFNGHGQVGINDMLNDEISTPQRVLL